jgi:hypothetical protein
MTKIGGGVPAAGTPILKDTIKTDTAKKTDVAGKADAGSKTANVQTAKPEAKKPAGGQESVIPRGKTPTDISQAENRYANAAKQISVFASALSDLLAKITVDQEGNDRKTALDSRTAARDSAKADANEKATKTKEEVEKAKIQAILTLVLAVVTAAVQIAGSAVEIYGAVKGVPQGKSGGVGQLTDLLGNATKNAGPKPAA